MSEWFGRASAIGAWVRCKNKKSNLINFKNCLKKG
jgi:hypothetical protein